MDNKLICFVIIGYGTKTDYSTGLAFDLDRTFENVIKPVFDDLQIECFRAMDYQHSGTIDAPMYRFIQKADIVIADISTLNANAIYELGVRHALRPRTTIVIAEAGLKYPFDLSHTSILHYKHLGEDIGVTEANRFKSELSSLIKSLIANPRDDSPVYTYLPGLKPPVFTVEEIKELKVASAEVDTLSTLLTSATKAISETAYSKAINLLVAAEEISPNDPFIKQQLALATYKQAIPNESEALEKAEIILNTLNPERTTDTETLGLLGAVYKRKYDLTQKPSDLETAIKYYEKGFIIGGDYYNGVNLAFMHLKQALVHENLNYAIADIIRAQRVYEITEKYCLQLLEDNFIERPDKVWILLTLAEVYYAKGQHSKSILYIDNAKEFIEGKFEIQSFESQKIALDPILEQTKRIISIFG